MRNARRPWSDHVRWLMLPEHLGYLTAEHGIGVTPRKILGGKRWQIALLTGMTSPQETLLAVQAQRRRECRHRLRTDSHGTFCMLCSEVVEQDPSASAESGQAGR